MMNTLSRPALRRVSLAAWVVALAGAASTAWSGASPVTAAQQRISVLFASFYPQLDALYKDLHAHPELAFQETRTAARLATEMRALGFEVTEKVGQTGIVALYRNGSGPTVMVRTELDALPVEEQTGLPYASRARAPYQGGETYVAHVCGHDLHMAIWVGTAKTLLAMKDRWHGTLMFIGQPAEEAVGGARAMIKDGVFTRFRKPDVGFALHAMPAASGEVLYRSGAVTSNASAMEIRFTGRGGHGSNPSDTIDPVLMAARFIVDVQSVISREKDPAAFGVVTIGAIQGGSAGNIIPDSVLLEGTVRSQSEEVDQKLIAGVRRTAMAVATMAGAPAPTITLEGGAKAVMNDPALSARTATAFTAAFGDHARLMPAPWSAGEDFTEFVSAGVPSFYFGLGIYDPARVARARAGGEPLPANHSPKFAPELPEPVIRTGVMAMSIAILGSLGPN